MSVERTIAIADTRVEAQHKATAARARYGSNARVWIKKQSWTKAGRGSGAYSVMAEFH